MDSLHAGLPAQMRGIFAGCSFVYLLASSAIRPPPCFLRACESVPWDGGRKSDVARPATCYIWRTDGLVPAFGSFRAGRVVTALVVACGLVLLGAAWCCLVLGA